MIFIQHPSNNLELKAPDDWDQGVVTCETLQATLTKDPSGLPVMCSFWRPDAEELAAMQAGYPVVLMVYSNSHPVVAMAVEYAGISFPETEA